MTLKIQMLCDLFNKINIIDKLYKVYKLYNEEFYFVKGKQFNLIRRFPR
jgi:hypothetical protein